MNANIYDPYPLSKFKQLDKIKSLLSRAEDHETHQQVHLEFDQEDDDGVTMAKVPRLDSTPTPRELSEQSLQYLVSVLEQDLNKTDKTILYEQMKEFQTKESLVSSSCLTVTGLLNVLRNLTNKTKLSQSLEQLQISFLAPLISNTIRRFKEDRGRILEDLSKLSAHQPTLMMCVLSGLICEQNLTEAVLSWLEVTDIDLPEEADLFLVWLKTVPVTSETINLADRFLSRRPELLQNSTIMTLLAENCYKNSTWQQNKCLKFAKFYRKIFITNLPPANIEHIIKFLKPIIDQNETFLRKRMEIELREKCPNLDDLDSKTTGEEQN